jgi:hypothetical protein
MNRSINGIVLVGNVGRDPEPCITCRRRGSSSWTGTRRPTSFSARTAGIASMRSMAVSCTRSNAWGFLWSRSRKPAALKPVRASRDRVEQARPAVPCPASGAGAGHSGTGSGSAGSNAVECVSCVPGDCTPLGLRHPRPWRGSRSSYRASDLLVADPFPVIQMDESMWHAVAASLRGHRGPL